MLPPLYTDALNEYAAIKRQTWDYFKSSFSSHEEVDELAACMVDRLTSELRRIRVHRVTGQNPMLEVRNIVKLFYTRERGEPTSLRLMNPYTRKFIRERNKRLFLKPMGDKPVLDSLTDLVVNRLYLPEHSPVEVFRDWLPRQFARSLEAIPAPILLEGGFGKVCRIMGGVFLYALTDLAPGAGGDEIRQRIARALKGGYYFGMFYPLIDDIFDHAKVFSTGQKQELTGLLNHWIGGDFSIPNSLSSVTSMNLLETIMKEFHELLPAEENRDLYIAAYIQHFSQIDDVVKEVNRDYSREEFYVPLIIKAAYTRILAAAISGIRLDSRLITHMIETGLSFQLMDDFRDWQSDLKHNLFTPFTWYTLAPQKGEQFNPFTLYMAVMQRYLVKFQADSSLERQLMRRLSISIQRFWPGDSGGEHTDTVWRIIDHNPEIGRQVRKIHDMKYRIMDPDSDFTRPIDQVAGKIYKKEERGL